MNSKKTSKINAVDLQTLKLWKYASTKAKLDWLESAFYFGKLKKFKKPA
jgi:hypothetical protein